MKILVCVKQVPGSSNVEVDPVTGVLKRSGIKSKMNPYDLYALETALRFKQEYGATVTAVTMGPPQAKEVIREAFMMGVDNGVILSDRRFGGADVLATSYTISQGLRAAGDFDLIICGKQTTDGDTAQVGAEVAEYLDIPHVTSVCKIHKVTDKSITLDIDTPLSIQTAVVEFPCLITVEKGIFEPRLPSYLLKLATEDREIKVLTLDDMQDKDPSRYGLNGSPTQVKRIFPPENSNTRESWDGTPAELTKKLYNFLNDNKYLQKLR